MGDIIKCLFNLLLQSVVGAVPVWLLTGGTTPRIQHQDQETTSLNRSTPQFRLQREGRREYTFKALN